jgi:hypothetical protein
MRPGFVGSYVLGPGRPAMRADTRENPVGKNGVMTHTIAGEEDSTTTPPTRHCQQGEEAKTWTCVPLLQRVSSSNE